MPIRRPLLIVIALWISTGCGAPEPELQDADADGFSSDEDCDDGDPFVYPGAPEHCNGRDDDCNGAIDDDATSATTLWYVDVDGDGFGDPETATRACAAPEGHIPRGEDCDDGDAEVYPGRLDGCDGVDSNCDGVVDEDPDDMAYLDRDGDGFGGPSLGWGCLGVDATLEPTDCDDASRAVFPGADEVCNGVDDDCDGYEDELPVDGALYLVDLDEDGWGSDLEVPACEVGEAYAPFADVFGLYLEGPGFYYEYYNPYRNLLIPVPVVATGGDCSDFDGGTYPGALERCDGRDNNCSGLVDDADPALTQALATRFHLDVDGDGYGRDTVYIFACAAPFNYVTASGDCDDDIEQVNPSELETCTDGLDNDCNGLIDESDPDAVGCP